MPRIRFDTSGDARHVRDEVGTERADLAAAWREAIKAPPGIACHVLPEDGGRRDIAADMQDETARLLFPIRLSFVARMIGVPATG